jgi:hypothetical protein
VVGLFLPFLQGVLFLLVAVALLSSEVPLVARLRDRVAPALPGTLGRPRSSESVKARFRGKSRSLTKLEARGAHRGPQNQIRHHDHLYYVKGRPSISDAAYDKLLRELSEREEFPISRPRLPDGAGLRQGPGAFGECATSRRCCRSSL